MLKNRILIMYLLSNETDASVSIIWEEEYYEDESPVVLL